MMDMVMGSLYKQFTKKAIHNFDDFHVAVLDIFNHFNSALPGRHFDFPTPDEIEACFTRWKEAKDGEEKKNVFTELISKKVKSSKLDDVTLITGIVSPPAAMAAKRAGENIPQLKLIKLIPDVIFVPTVTIMAIVSAKLSRRMNLK
ncbi:Calcium ion-binding protein [Hirschfeldia incana]|nr:Calcium ion-binding protein [Hirschfeldia incana]